MQGVGAVGASVAILIRHQGRTAEHKDKQGSSGEQQDIRQAKAAVERQDIRASQGSSGERQDIRASQCSSIV